MGFRKNYPNPKDYRKQPMGYCPECSDKHTCYRCMENKMHQVIKANISADEQLKELKGEPA